MAEPVNDPGLIPLMLSRPSRILLLGGTAEAAALAGTLVEAGHDVTTSLAGRTREPRPPAGQCRVGGFGGGDGLAAWMRENRIDLLIDATHPFALQMSANAVKAAASTGLRLIILQRPLWQPMAGDLWHHVANIDAARDWLPSGAIALLALGSQHIAPFAVRADVRFVIRMVDRPDAPLPFANHALVVGRPGGTVAEMQLLTDHRISHIVCRNSGGQGAYAKIEAARRLKIPVVMIGRAFV
jgi:precorrin-6A/cobalt-precorrin-6A reductase